MLPPLSPELDNIYPQTVAACCNHGLSPAGTFVQGNETHVGLIKDYRRSVEKELSEICKAIHNLLDGKLIPAAQTGESNVFYYKMYVAACAE